jgi:hypothetical protein
MTLSHRSRTFALAAAVVASVTLLPACTSTVQDAAPKRGCLPARAHISFGKPVQGAKAPIEAHLISFDGGVQLSTPIQTTTDTSAFFSYAGETSFADISSVSDSDWQSVLLSRLRRTKSVPSGFGNGTAVDPSDVAPDTQSGKYVVVTEEALTTVPFSVSCTGDGKLSGTIAAYADTGSYTTLTECGAIPAGTPDEIVALMGPACTQE